MSETQSLAPALTPTAAPTTIATPLLTAPQLLWQVELGSALAASPTFAANHVVAATETAVVGLDPDSGAEQWRYAPDDGVWLRALAADTDTVYTGIPGQVVALDAADGSVRWQQAVVGEMLWSPLVVDGRVYVGTAFVGPGIQPDANGRAWVYALDAASGDVVWSQETAAYTLTTPAAGESLLFVGGSFLGETAVDEGGHIRLHAYDLNSGDLRWTVEREDGFIKSLATDGDQLFFLAYTDMVYGLDADNGEEMWRYPTENWSPGFTYADGALYLGSDNAFVHAVESETGTAVWRQQLAGTFNGPRAQPAVAGDYLAFQGTDDRLYYAERENGRILLQTEPQARSRVAPTLADGLLLLAGAEGTLYVYGIP